MIFPRQSGILLHPTSLPGKFGIGDLGSEAHKFIDLLAESAQCLWQILPLGPTGISNSPYNSVSVFAGNPMLIDPESMVKHGLLIEKDLEDIPAFPDIRVDFDTVFAYKQGLLLKAFKNFKAAGFNQEYESFCKQKSSWLDSYALFMALKGKYQSTPWQQWPEDIKWRKAGALESCRKELSGSIQYYQFEQFEFNRQWTAIKQYCHKKNINIIGDIPIFIDADSDSVWCNPELFDLDENGIPREVAGVPPDYFSSTGQFWGNPLYRWDVIEQTGYSWWEERIMGALSMVDIIRLDHFRGFESYWAVPVGSDSAARGQWKPGPGDKMFQTLEGNIGPLPFIAEDLGMITDRVRELRDRLGFPGMRVLQFAFGDDSKTNEHRPYNYIPHCVAYTGTHDNDTTIGWFNSKISGAGSTEKQSQEERARVLRYTGTDGHEINWDFIRLALSSIANTAIIPFQDVLGLDSRARMNTPSTRSGNWEWRFTGSQLRDKYWIRLKELTTIYGRAS
jgi:4-alpha-glucanotransferase